MLHFDEVIWQLNANLKSGRQIVHQERDVNYDEESLGENGKLALLIKSLLGQDAACSYADNLTVIPFRAWQSCIWAIASDGVAGHDAYSVLLSFH